MIAVHRRIRRFANTLSNAGDTTAIRRHLRDATGDESLDLELGDHPTEPSGTSTTTTVKRGGRGPSRPSATPRRRGAASRPRRRPQPPSPWKHSSCCSRRASNSSSLRRHGQPPFRRPMRLAADSNAISTTAPNSACSWSAWPSPTPQTARPLTDPCVRPRATGCGGPHRSAPHRPRRCGNHRRARPRRRRDGDRRHLRDTDVGSLQSLCLTREPPLAAGRGDDRLSTRPRLASRRPTLRRQGIGGPTEMPRTGQRTGGLDATRRRRLHRTQRGPRPGLPPAAGSPSTTVTSSRYGCHEGGHRHDDMVLVPEGSYGSCATAVSK